jgi:hypothetical protein
VNGAVVDLYGIDAPELGQLCDLGEKAEPCGLLAAFALQKLIDLSIEPVVCAQPEGNGEAAGQVCRAGADDLGHTMLAGGYVTALDAAPPGYRDAEARAKQASLGVWRTDFVNPADWREGRRLASERLAGNSSCKIKGVITASGSKVYYVPTDQGYNSVELDPTFGGEMLCSEEVARRDGWRRP